MAAAAAAAAAASSCCVPSIVLHSRWTSRSRTTSLKSGRRRGRVVGNLGHLAEVVRKDMEFMKRGISRGFEWANISLRIPQVSKTLDDFLWLRPLEDPSASALPSPSWPRPSYPGLSAVDLFMADLKALEAYAVYFYYLSKLWSRPLPEVYDSEGIADYFSRRPHLVALRLLEVFSSFASAAIRIRTTGIRKVIGSNLEKDVDGNIAQYNFGVILKETMLELGPTFIKVGQSLSTRPDIIGSEISKALSELHDQIPPFPRTLAMRIIEEELGSPAESFFSYLSEEPVAAASFGQVYRGSTLDGSIVAVKVQRPDMHHVVVRDIYILRLGLGILQKIAKRKNDLRLYADELGKGLVGELDYTLEAANATEFQEAHSRFKFVRVPKIFDHLSGKRILTMEWIVGDSPTALYSISTGSSSIHGSTYSERQKLDAKRRLLDLVNKGVEASLVQLLETGLLHADPHPGNLRYTSSGQLGFLDFGLLCRMEKRHQFAMLASIVHIVNGDWPSLVHSLTEMDVVRPGTNIRHVTLDLEYSLGEVKFKDNIPDVKFSRVLGKIWSVALKYHFRMPPYYTLVLRSLASLEGLAVAGDKNFKTFEAAYPYVVRKLLTENSAATRKILHSVVFNKRKEFQWHRLALFLRVGGTRKGLQQIVSPNHDTSTNFAPNKANSSLEAVNFVMRLLPSKEGVVLRRLLMTANEVSLVQAMVSKEAKFFREQFCRVIADVLYQWVSEAIGLGKGIAATQHQFKVRMGSGPDKTETNLSKFSNDYILLRDRRLKLIFSKVMQSARKDPLLMMKFCWVSFIMFVTASASACHRVVVSLSEVYLGPVSFVPKRFVVTA